MESVTDKAPSKKALATLKLFNFFSYGSFAVLYTFFPIYFAEQGLSMIEIGMIMAGGPFISIIANPFWGYLSDKHQNIKRTIIVLLLGNIIVVQFVFHLKAFTIVYIMMLIFFFFQSPMASQGNSLILNAIEGTRYKFGAFRLWGSLGYAVTALAAGPIILLLGLERLWIIYTFLLLLSIIFTIGMPRGNLTTVSVVFSIRGYAAVFKNRIFLLFVFLGVLVSVPNAANSTFVSLYVQELGGTAVAIGWASFLSAFFEIFVFLLLDRFIKKEMRFMIICLIAVSLLFSIRWLMMSLATEAYHILMIQVLHCVTFGGYYYLGTTITALLVPNEYRASGQAAFALTWGGVSGIIAGFTGGWLYQTYGANVMYQASSVIALLGMFGFMVLLKLAKDQEAKKWKERVVNVNRA